VNFQVTAGCALIWLRPLSWLNPSVFSQREQWAGWVLGPQDNTFLMRVLGAQVGSPTALFHVGVYLVANME